MAAFFMRVRMGRMLNRSQLAATLADIDHLITNAESLIVTKGDGDALQQASRVLAELRLRAANYVLGDRSDRHGARLSGSSCKMRRRFVGLLVGLLLLLAPVTANAARSDVIDLADYPMEKVWRCANSSVTPATDANGEPIWRWEIGSGEAFLWLNEDLPVHRDLPRYQRLLYEVNFAQGQINQFWPRTVGLLAPPFDKMFCEWNLFYFTHPHKQWIAYQQVFNDPSWFAHHFSQIPRDIRLDHSTLLGFACLAKGQSCVVELR